MRSELGFRNSWAIYTVKFMSDLNGVGMIKRSYLKVGMELLYSEKILSDIGSKRRKLGWRGEKEQLKIFLVHQTSTYEIPNRCPIFY